MVEQAGGAVFRFDGSPLGYGNPAVESRIEKPEYAIEPCKKAIEINKRKNISSGDDLAYIVLGNAQFVLNDFQSASDNFDIYFKKVNKLNFSFIRNFNFMRMGLAHDFSGKREAAIAAYKYAKKETIDKNPSDALAYARSQHFMRYPPGKNYKRVVIANNLLFRKKDDDALKEYILAISSENITEDEKIVCYYNLGDIQLRKKLLDDAQECYFNALKTKPNIEKHLIPHSYFKLGQIMMKKNLISKAKEYFEQANDYEDYFFEDRLRDSIKIEMKKIR